jgi:hypothetical protein
MVIHLYFFSSGVSEIILTGNGAGLTIETGVGCPVGCALSTIETGVGETAPPATATGATETAFFSIAEIAFATAAADAFSGDVADTMALSFVVVVIGVTAFTTALATARSGLSFFACAVASTESEAALTTDVSTFVIAFPLTSSKGCVDIRGVLAFASLVGVADTMAAPPASTGVGVAGVDAAGDGVDVVVVVVVVEVVPAAAGDFPACPASASAVAVVYFPLRILFSHKKNASHN